MGVRGDRERGKEMAREGGGGIFRCEILEGTLDRRSKRFVLWRFEWVGLGV